MAFQGPASRVIKNISNSLKYQKKVKPITVLEKNLKKKVCRNNLCLNSAPIVGLQQQQLGLPDFVWDQHLSQRLFAASSVKDSENDSGPSGPHWGKYVGLLLATTGGGVAGEIGSWGSQGGGVTGYG